MTDLDETGILYMRYADKLPPLCMISIQYHAEDNMKLLVKLLDFLEEYCTYLFNHSGIASCITVLYMLIVLFLHTVVKTPALLSSILLALANLSTWPMFIRILTGKEKTNLIINKVVFGLVVASTLGPFFL